MNLKRFFERHGIGMIAIVAATAAVLFLMRIFIEVHS